MAIGSMKVKVKWAKYPKRVGQSTRPGNSVRGEEQFRNCNHWKKGAIPMKLPADGVGRNNQQPARATMNDEYMQLKKTVKVVNVEAVQDNLDWLGRSLTCISDTPRDIESLRLTINNAFQEKVVVRDLGKFKFLLTMESKEIKERLKNEGDERLKQWFSSISDWAEEDVCQTRRLWLEIIGLPIQLWSEQNIKKIAENWGDVVLMEEESLKLKSFASAKVIIDTLSVFPIEDEAIVQVQNKGFRVSVFEAKIEFTIFHTGPLEEVSSGSPTPKDKGKLAGMESVGVMENQVNLDPGSWQKNHSNSDVLGSGDYAQARAGS